MSKEESRGPWVCDDCKTGDHESVYVDGQGKKHCGCVDLDQFRTLTQMRAWSGPFCKEHPEVRREP